MQTVIWGTVSVAESRLTIRRLMIAAGIGRKTMNEKLRPCPFCGGEAYMIEVEPHTHKIAIWVPDSVGECFIECTNCTCAMSANTKEEAVAAWNRRAEK